MTATIPVASQTEPFYPSADGKPVAETYEINFSTMLKDILSYGLRQM